MSHETLFTLINAFVLPFWLLLLIAPFSKPTRWLVHSGVVPLVLGLLYIVTLSLSMAGDMPEGASMQSLQGLQIAFSDPRALLAGWMHYLVFDLFVGAWIVRDAKRQGMPHWAVVIPVILTFATGPFGLLLYVGLHAAWKRRFSFDELAA